MLVFFAFVNLSKLIPYHFLCLLYLLDTKTIIALAPLIPGFITEQIPLKYILIGMFIIVGVVVFTLFKWAENILDLVTTIMGSRPFLLILCFIALAQAIALPVVWFAFGAPGGILWFFFH